MLRGNGPNASTETPMPNAIKQIPELTDKDKRRFLSKINTRDKESCWPWKASTCQGYGQFVIKGSVFKSSRVSFHLFCGEAPTGMMVCHTCDNPACCNPNHLFLGSSSDNMRDMISKGRGNKASGDAHFSKTNPEKLARGDKNGKSTKPDKTPRGEDFSSAVLNEAVVKEMRLIRRNEGFTYRKISKLFGFHLDTVRLAIKGLTWAHVK